MPACAIILSERGKEVSKMMNWYNDPEAFADDYEELQELLEELAEEEE